MNTAEKQIYKVHQIQFTKQERAAINGAGDWGQAAEENTRVKTHCETSLFGAENYSPEMFTDYRHVANITAKGLEDVFEISNIGPEESIERLSSKHSLSVGDIVQLGGLYWMVDPCGFTEIEVPKPVRYDVTVTSPNEGRPDITMAVLDHNEPAAILQAREEVSRHLDAHLVDVEYVRSELYVFCESGYLPEGF